MTYGTRSLVIPRRYLHVKIDKKTNLIETCTTTNASVHDSNIVEPLIEDSDKGQKLYCDAGYTGREEVITKHGMIPAICENDSKGRPLTDEQKANNRKKSTIRCLVEHTFGYRVGVLGGSIIRNVGMVRAKAQNGITNLV